MSNDPIAARLVVSTGGFAGGISAGGEDSEVASRKKTNSLLKKLLNVNEKSFLQALLGKAGGGFIAAAGAFVGAGGVAGGAAATGAAGAGGAAGAAATLGAGAAAGAAGVLGVEALLDIDITGVELKATAENSKNLNNAIIEFARKIGLISDEKAVELSQLFTQAIDIQSGFNTKQEEGVKATGEVVSEIVDTAKEIKKTTAKVSDVTDAFGGLVVSVNNLRTQIAQINLRDIFGGGGSRRTTGKLNVQPGAQIFDPNTGQVSTLDASGNVTVEDINTGGI